MSMQGKDGQPMPLTMGQKWELGQALRKDRGNSDKNFELPAATVRAKMLALGHSLDKVNRFQQLTQNGRGNIRFDLD